MHKRELEVVADLLKKSAEFLNQEAHFELVELFIEELAHHNPLFDKEKFYNASTPE
jgi:hypothetical protein|tara:strand:+ start:1126 stop:1293 length:168 start_codon:yes stop_codon:yes gene_type:complete